MNINRRLLEMLRTVQGLFALTVLFNIMGGIFILFWALTLSHITDEVFLKNANLEMVMPFLWSLLGLVFIRAIFILGSEISAARLAVKIKNQMRHDLVEKLINLGSGFIRGESSAALLSTSLQGVEQIDSYFSQYLPQLILAAILPLLILVVIIPLDWLTALVLLLTAPLIPVFMILIGKSSEKLTVKQFNSLKKMSAFFLDTIQGLPTLKLLNQSKKQEEKIAEVGENYRKTTMSVLRLTFLSSLTLEWLATLSVAVVAVEIGIRLLSGGIAFEQAFFILIIAPEFYLPLRMLGLRFHASAAGVAAANSIFKIMDEPLRHNPVIHEPNKLADTKNNSLILEQPFLIQFEDVSYSYPNRDQDAVSQISFCLQNGTQTAVVGKSGAGKSTLAALLMGLISPTSGRILINQLDLSQIPADIWRSYLAWIPQRPFLFNRTLRENIILGKPHAGEEAIQEAVKMASLEEVIKNLPHGLETNVGENGARLSGGQAQRVILARAFLRNAPILIMDEPTANLDINQEKILIRTTQQLIQGKTVIMIAHRLASIKQAGQILVLEDGRLVETGDHGALIKNQKQYYNFMHVHTGNP